MKTNELNADILWDLVKLRRREDALAYLEKCLPPLELVTTPTVDTASAARYLNRRPQTLRMWAMRDGSGPIRPVRIHGRLGWSVSELRRILGVA
jgi:hypothetical protein